MQRRSGFVEEPDHIVVRPAVLVPRRPGKSILPSEGPVEGEAADQPVSPVRGISPEHLASAKWQIVIPCEDKNLGPVVVARPVADPGIDKEVVRLMGQGLGPGEVAQELKAVTESFVYANLQRVVAARGLVGVVPQVLRPSKRGTECYTEQLGASVEIGSAIVLRVGRRDATKRTRNRVDVLRSACGTKIGGSNRRGGAGIESRDRLRVRARLVRRVKHIVNGMAAHVRDLQRHGRRNLTLDRKIPGIQRRKPYPKRARGYAYSIRQRKVAVGRNWGEREAGRSLCQIENRRGVCRRVQVLRNLRGKRKREDFAIGVSRPALPKDPAISCPHHSVGRHLVGEAESGR